MAPNPTKGESSRKESPAPITPRYRGNFVDESVFSSEQRNTITDDPPPPPTLELYEPPERIEKTKPGFLNNVRTWMGRQINGTSRIEEEFKVHVSRDEYRNFKNAWRAFDPHDTGYVPRTGIPRLLAVLAGVFNMSMYLGYTNYTVSEILDKVQGRHRSLLATTREVSLQRLNNAVATIDAARVTRRRREFCLFYNEVKVAVDPDKGIHRDLLLTILSQYRWKDLASR